MTAWHELDGGGTQVVSTTWQYDRVGNIRHTVSSYRTLDAGGNTSAYTATKDLWYLYDQANRS